MRVRGLADTGALLAFLDADDAWHSRCVRAFAELPLPLGTSLAVLTELFHLLGTHPHDNERVRSLLRSGAVVVLPVVEDDLPSLERLMIRYADRPMDLADATLVHLAEREGVTTVFTIDNDDFETYRAGGRKRFRVLPGRESR